MKAYFIKELYEQVADYEYNRVNPYVQAIGMLKSKHEDIEVIGTRTFTEVIGSLQIPIMEVHYDRPQM